MMRCRTEVLQEIDAPVDLLWTIVSDFPCIDRWSNLKVREIHGAGVGCRRTVEMESGAIVIEELLSCDEEKRTLCYSILPPNPFPMLDYRSTISIEAVSSQRSRIRWMGEYTLPTGIDCEKMENLLRKVYVIGIGLLLQYLRTFDPIES
jgi:Polyketide cyclase / dehydrase and lipid transport